MVFRASRSDLLVQNAIKTLRGTSNDSKRYKFTPGANVFYCYLGLGTKISRPGGVRFSYDQITIKKSMRTIT